MQGVKKVFSFEMRLISSRLSSLMLCINKKKKNIIIVKYRQNRAKEIHNSTFFFAFILSFAFSSLPHLFWTLFFLWKFYTIFYPVACSSRSLSIFFSCVFFSTPVASFHHTIWFLLNVSFWIDWSVYWRFSIWLFFYSLCTSWTSKWQRNAKCLVRKSKRFTGHLIGVERYVWSNATQ